MAGPNTPAFAVGFGDLTVHEVATDVTDPSRAYLSYHAGWRLGPPRAAKRGTL